MVSNSKPKIVFLDWYGTLSKSKFWGHLEQKDPKLFKQIEDNLFKKNSGLIVPWMRGQFSAEDVSRVIADETYLDYNFVFHEFIKGCQSMEFVYPEIPKLIVKIRNIGIKVYIASDNMDSLERWTVSSMGLNEIFDGVINSFSMNALKHDFDKKGRSLFFDSVLGMENIKPYETVLIDDSLDKNDLLTNYGINYRQISEEKTVLMELENILKT